jgi:hypothetical protein
MAKTTGLGDRLFIGGYDISGDTQSVQKLATGGNKTLDMTDITESAFERQLGEFDGQWSFTVFFDKTGAHVPLSALPRTDTQAMYCRGAVVGNPAACMIAKQTDYAPTRGTDGSLTLAVSAQSNAFGYEWGQLLTAGVRTDTTATNGTAVDGGASTAFGLQAYLQVFALTGTTVTVTLQDSADNVTFANIASAAFTAVTAAPAWQRISISNAATVRRYVRAITAGTFTSVSFACAFNRNSVAGVAF